MRENGNAIDEVHGCRPIAERRINAVYRELYARQVSAAPIHIPAVIVGTIAGASVARHLRHMTDDAAGTTTPVEYAAAYQWHKPAYLVPDPFRRLPAAVVIALIVHAECFIDHVGLRKVDTGMAEEERLVFFQVFPVEPGIPQLIQLKDQARFAEEGCDKLFKVHELCVDTVWVKIERI